MSTINQREKPTISLTDLCYNKMMRRFAPTMVLRNGVAKLYLNGKEITEKELYDLYPVPAKLKTRENSDPTKWMEDY